MAVGRLRRQPAFDPCCDLPVHENFEGMREPGVTGSGPATVLPVKPCGWIHPYAIHDRRPSEEDVRRAACVYAALG